MSIYGKLDRQRTTKFKIRKVDFTLSNNILLAPSWKN
jgi:hypothetical protein